MSHLSQLCDAPDEAYPARSRQRNLHQAPGGGEGEEGQLRPWGLFTISTWDFCSDFSHHTFKRHVYHLKGGCSRPLDFRSGPGAHRGRHRHQRNAQDAGEFQVQPFDKWLTGFNQFKYFFKFRIQTNKLYQIHPPAGFWRPFQPSSHSASGWNGLSNPTLMNPM